MVCKSNQKRGAENVFRKICIQIAETETTVKMFNKMIRCGVCTNDVKSFSMNQASLRRVHKNTSPRIEKAAMKAKRQDALAHVKRLRQERYILRKSLISIYGGYTNKLAKRINKIRSSVKLIKKDMWQVKINKINHLLKKYNFVNNKDLTMCEKPIIDILSKVNIFKHKIEAKPPLGPLICHPDITVSDSELALLNRGPKYMVRDKITLDTVNLEVEKGIIKHKYQVGEETAGNSASNPVRDYSQYSQAASNPENKNGGHVTQHERDILYSKTEIDFQIKDINASTGGLLDNTRDIDQDQMKMTTDIIEAEARAIYDHKN